MDSLDKITLLTAEEFCKTNSEDLVSLWRKNHQNLLDHIKNQDIPYFGLHGTNRESAQLIEAQESTYGMFNLVTFYNKKKTEEDVYQLYHMCSYVLPYAKPDNIPGKILVFSLEENGKNVTYPWEKLFLGPCNIFGCFEEDDELNFKLLNPTSEDVQKFDNWRTSAKFSKDLKQPSTSLDFKKHYCGNISFPNILFNSSCKSYAEACIKQRFSAQEILIKALKMTAEKNHDAI